MVPAGMYGGLCYPTLEVFMLICLVGFDANVYGLHLYGCMVRFLEILPEIRHQGSWTLA